MLEAVGGVAPGAADMRQQERVCDVVSVEEGESAAVAPEGDEAGSASYLITGGSSHRHLYRGVPRSWEGSARWRPARVVGRRVAVGGRAYASG